MEKSAVIFDIDGLLINSEPLWNQAAAEIFRQYGIILTEEQYALTTGLRSKEFVTHWLIQHKIPATEFDRVEEKIVNLALSLIDKDATLMPGVEHIFQFFLKRDFKSINSLSKLSIMYSLCFAIKSLAPCTFLNLILSPFTL